MNSDQATFLLNFLLPQVEEEATTTGRVLAAVSNNNYKPDANSRSSYDLAWHIASSDVWFLNSIADGTFPMEEAKPPATLKTGKDIAAWYGVELPKGVARVRAMAADALAKELNFFGMFNLPAVAYLQFLLKHSVHHRGQLASYLRASGSKVPNIYGGSYDEPLQMPAGA